MNLHQRFPQQFHHNFYGFLPSSKLKRKLFIIQIFQIIKKNHVKNFFDRKGKLKSSLKLCKNKTLKRIFTLNGVN